MAVSARTGAATSSSGRALARTRASAAGARGARSAGGDGLLGHSASLALGRERADAIAARCREEAAARLRPGGLAGSGLCGTWTRGACERGSSCTRKETERYIIHVDGSLEYSRQVRSWTAPRECERTDEACEHFAHEEARGKGSISLGSSGDTLYISCRLDVSTATGVGTSSRADVRLGGYSGTRGGGLVKGGCPLSRTTLDHCVEITREEFEQLFSKFVSAPSVGLPPLPGPFAAARRRNAGALAKAGPALARRSASEGASPEASTSGVEERVRDLARASVRLGDFARARQLLTAAGVGPGGVAEARRLLGAALEIALVQRGEAHASVSAIRHELDALTERAASPLGLPIGSQVALPPLPSARARRARSHGVDAESDAPLESARRHLPDSARLSRRAPAVRLGPDRVKEIFEEWADSELSASAGTVGGSEAVPPAQASGVSPPLRAPSEAGAAVGARAISRDALGSALGRLRRGMADGDIDHIFSAADADKDGLLGFTEFAAWLAECRSLHPDLEHTPLLALQPAAPPAARAAAAAAAAAVGLAGAEAPLATAARRPRSREAATREEARGEAASHETAAKRDTPRGRMAAVMERRGVATYIIKPGSFIAPEQ